MGIPSNARDRLATLFELGEDITVTPQELNRYRTRLLAMRDRLTSEINQMAPFVLTDARAEGEHDRAVSESVDKELALERDEENIRRQVVEALARIESGNYGQCQDCGQRIAAGRLEALPYALVCIECERKKEAG